MIKRSQIKFHESFQPELSYLSKILDLANHHFSGTKFEISEITGIPTGKQKGKVEPHIRYATYMGLINHSIDESTYTLSLTPVGEIIVAQDPYLHETLTHWILHYFISKPDSKAVQWSFLINRAHHGFLQSSSNEYLLSEANKCFQTTCSFEEMYGPIKRCYADGCLADLDFLEWDAEIKFLEQTENPELIFLYGFVLLDLWETVLPERKEITVEELSESLSYGKFLGLNMEDCHSVFDSLSDEGIVSVNKQLVPATIIKEQESSEVLPLLFSRLL